MAQYDVIVDRLRPRRLCLRHPLCPAGPEDRLRRGPRNPRRHLPQRGLHPLEGAAACHPHAPRGGSEFRRDGPEGQKPPRSTGRRCWPTRTKDHRPEHRRHRISCSRRTRIDWLKGWGSVPEKGRVKVGDEVARGESTSSSPRAPNPRPPPPSLCPRGPSRVDEKKNFLKKREMVVTSTGALALKKIRRRWSSSAAA